MATKSLLACHRHAPPRRRGRVSNPLHPCRLSLCGGANIIAERSLLPAVALLILHRGVPPRCRRRVQRIARNRRVDGGWLSAPPRSRRGRTVRGRRLTGRAAVALLGVEQDVDRDTGAPDISLAHDNNSCSRRRCLSRRAWACRLASSTAHSATLSASVLGRKHDSYIAIASQASQSSPMYQSPGSTPQYFHRISRCSRTE